MWKRDGSWVTMLSREGGGSSGNARGVSSPAIHCRLARWEGWPGWPGRARFGMRTQLLGAECADVSVVVT